MSPMLALTYRPYKDSLYACNMSTLHYRCTKDHGSIKEIWPETSNVGLSSALLVSPTEIQKVDSCVGLKRTGYYVVRERVNGDFETAVIVPSLTDNYSAEQLLAKVASIRTVLPTLPLRQHLFTEDEGSIKEIWPETRNAGLSTDLRGSDCS